MAVSVDYRPARSRSALAALLTVLILVPTGYLFFRVWQHNDDDRSNTKLEKQGVEYLTSLSPLISALAESESLALAGSTAAPASLTAATARVAATDQRLGDALKTHDRWTGLRDRITKLPATARAQAFSAHVEAADLALALYNTVRSNSTLVRDPDNDLSHLQQAVAVDLPTAAVQATRMGDLAPQLAAAQAAVQSSATQSQTVQQAAQLGYQLVGAQFAGSLTTVQTSVGALTDDLQAAVDDTNSQTLSGNLVNSLDAFRRGIETMSGAASPLTGKPPNTAALASARAQLQTSLANLDGTLTKEMTGLLNKRLDTLDNQRLEAVGAAALVVLLMLLAMIVRATGRRRRPAPVTSDTGRGATTNRNGPPPGYGSLIDPPGYGAGDPTRRSVPVLFGKFRILGKLALLVLVPLLGVIALTVPIVVNRIGAAGDARDTADRVQLAAKVGSAVQELEEERLLSVGYYFTVVQQPDLVVQSAKAADAISGLMHLDQSLPPALTKAVTAAGKLDSTRQYILNRALTPDLIISQFTNVITPILDALNLRQYADLSTAVGRQVFALDQALRSDDQISQASGWLTSAVLVHAGATNAAQRKAAEGLTNAFFAVLVPLQTTIIAGQSYFTPAQYQLYLSAQVALSARLGSDFITGAATDPQGTVNKLDPTTLFPGLQSVNVLGGFVEKRIATDVTTRANTNQRNALRDALLVGAASLLLLLLVFLLSYYMARAVARPLQRLTVSADRIARAAEGELQRVADDEEESVRPIRLDPVDVAARDEIGDLARAFDRVQTTAARLVERQVMGRRNVAQMFGHVGRRTQNLVGRQLALIDNLERRETDSDRLRELYRLDHMSSRLRRNASSLVVLSGGAGANEHMAPLPLSDVVRLGLGEIEDYTRVDVDVPEDILVVPAVVADLTLLLAELMENATSFSPPHTRVLVTANELGGGARLAIVDQGLGLPPERLAEENARLTRRERLDLAPSEVLGLFVVGRLARRHGIEVTLTDTPEGGVTAWVDLQSVHLVSRENTIATGTPIQATVGAPQHGDFSPLLAGASTRSVPGSALPFDANVLNRATRTLQSARSWNAFIPVRLPAALEAGPAALEAPREATPWADDPAPWSEPPSPWAETPTPWSDAPAQTQYEAQPYEPAPYEQRPYDQNPYDQNPYDQNSYDQNPYDMGTPVAGRFPAVTPELAAQPRTTTGDFAEPEPPVVMEGPIVMSAPADAIQLPRQRTPEGGVQPRNGNGQPPLRRRVPGNQLPLETGTKLPSAPPSTDDAVAAREAFEAFEAGVTRAQWDVIEADMASPPAAGHSPLTRRVPGATLPVAESPNPRPPATPAKPLDPDEARALVEQFEYGVALALNETQPQHEGQPR